LIVREDGFSLYGFMSASEQKLFDLLRSVSGVGPKSALAMLSALSVDEIIDAVANEDDSQFRQVSGVGPKTAKLITVTLAGKLGSPSRLQVSAQGIDLSVVVDALTNLGWSERSALDAVQKSSRALGADASTSELLKDALTRLGSPKTTVGFDE
jgi:Holliday junction DNA helicase RuvA